MPTADAPSFRAPSPTPGARAPAIPTLPAGSEIDDFVVVDVLGRGAFGIVYLARQKTLDRRVALKVAANHGSEGRTMARLEHQHIVQVFSESVDATGMQRLLCMQLVPGTSLQHLIARLHADRRPAVAWRGSDLLAILDAATQIEAPFDPAALHDREAIAKMNRTEATAWIGARLAEALDFAHRHGVLHRDIKPANILMNRYGHPLLADFNISSSDAGAGPDESFGGTLAYMAPEHLDAFHPLHPTTPRAVTEQSDIYALGIVLFELHEGRSPWEQVHLPTSLAERVSWLSDLRKQTSPQLPPGPTDPTKVLLATLIRCLRPQPAERYAASADLAAALDGCREFSQAYQALPAAGPITRRTLKRPFLWILALALIPHLISSLINIYYNQSYIMDDLTSTQQASFNRVVVGYNLVAYPVLAAIMSCLILPLWWTWRELCGDLPLAAETVDRARQRALSLPIWTAVLSALGWFPGGLLFPSLIDWTAGPVSEQIYTHFAISFFLSGLIAFAYAYCGVQFVALRSLYPRLWNDVEAFRTRAQRELPGMALRHLVMQGLAVAIPLSAAVLLLLPFVTHADELSFRYLVIALIIAGGLGFLVTTAATRRLTQTLVAITGHD